MRSSFLVKTLLSLFLFSALAAGGSGLQPHKTFIIVHDSWQGLCAWQAVKDNLEVKGQRVIVVELPSHGGEGHLTQDLLMDSYRDKVMTAITEAGGKVILVGHSIGGMVITAVADKMPKKIEKLVYVGAFVPVSGQSLLDIVSKTDSEYELGQAGWSTDEETRLDSEHTLLATFFYADSLEGIKQLLINNYRNETPVPFSSKVFFQSKTFTKLDKYYVKTLEDTVIDRELQAKMIEASGITKVYPIQSGHSPFLSAPNVLSKILLSIIGYKY